MPDLSAPETLQLVSVEESWEVLLRPMPPWDSALA